MDLSKIPEIYKAHTLVTLNSLDGKEDIFIGPPFFHLFKRDEGILIRVTKVGDSEIILSDGHKTTDYLEEMDVDLNLYADRKQKILDRFGMILDGRVVRLKFSFNDENDILRYIGYFIQGISLLANIDL